MADTLCSLNELRLEKCAGLDVDGTVLVESEHVHVDHPFELKITVRNTLKPGGGSFKNINIIVQGSKLVRLLDENQQPITGNKMELPQGDTTLAGGRSLDQMVWIIPTKKPSDSLAKDLIADLRVTAEFDVASYFSCRAGESVLFDIQTHD